MEYRKIINFLDNTPNQPIKFRTKTWVEINDDSVERMPLIVKLNLELLCEGQVYMIIVMYIYL